MHCTALDYILLGHDRPPHHRHRGVLGVPRLLQGGAPQSSPVSGSPHVHLGEPVRIKMRGGAELVWTWRGEGAETGIRGGADPGLLGEPVGLQLIGVHLMAGNCRVEWISPGHMGGGEVRYT